MNEIFCDVLIVGAGIVGSTLAVRLVQSGFRVVIIDSSFPLLSSQRTSFPSLRVSAINTCSVKILQEINIWDKIQSSFYMPFHTLEIWECLSSKVTFNSLLLNLPNMGFIIENNRLQFTLWETFFDYRQLIFYHPCFLYSICYKKHYWELKLSNGKVINSFLLVGADGKDSSVRNKMGIRVIKSQYRQFCMVLSISFTKNQNGTVWQVFTPFGPRGFIPLFDYCGLLMWYDTIDYIQQLKKLPHIMLERKIQNEFGERLGNIKIHKNVYFPLFRQHAHSYVKEGLALVGDSAHTVNPLAGQGINLGLQDVDALVNVLISAKKNEYFWNTLKILKKYQHKRIFDNTFMQTGIDTIYILFSNDILFIKYIRNISLMFLEHSPLLKKYILKYALGLS